jgi:hypothetical protein
MLRTAGIVPLLAALALPLSAACDARIGVAEAGGLVAAPNLKPVDVSIFTTKWDPSAVHRATINWRVVNDGTLPVTASFRTTITANGVSYDVYANSLAVGESVYFDRTITLPTSGLLNFSITTDVDNWIGEDNESDNWTAGSLDGKKPAVDQWYAIGPRKMYAHNTGALFSVAVEKTNANVIYAAGVAPSGGSDGDGIWKTTDGGANWDPIGNTLPTMRVQSIAVDPSAAFRLVAATPIGIFRSEDYGGSWRRTSMQPGGSRLIIHPTISDTLFLNSPGGIVRSLDGGFTWSNVLSFAGASYGDLNLDPGNSNRLIAAVRHPTDNAIAGFYESKNGGTTWRKLVGCSGGMLPNAAGMGLVAAIGAKTYLVVRSATSWKLYHTTTTACADSSGNTDDLWAVSPWTPPDIPAMWNDIHADPTTASKVYATGTDFWSSTNGGDSFTKEASSHADHQGLAFHPSNPAILFDVNDGGIYRRNADATWDFIGEGIQTAHIYDIADGPAPNFVIAGFQDDGTNTYDGSTTVWTLPPGMSGDGEGVDVDSTGTRLYWMGQNLNQMRVHIGGVNKQLGCTLPDCDSGYDFMADPFDPTRVWAACGPVFRSVQNPDCATSSDPWLDIAMPSGVGIRKLAADVPGQLYYAGSSDGRLLAARTNAINSPWAVVYDTGDSKGTKDIDIDPVDPTVIYVGFGGTSGPRRVVRLKRQASWTPGPLTGAAVSEISGGLPSGLGVMSIAVDRMFPDRVYVATQDGVYRGMSSDGGATFSWSLYASGMPSSLEVRDLEVHPKTGVMRAATFGQGVFEVYTDRRNQLLQVSKVNQDDGSGTVASAPSGISCGSDCSQSYEFGTPVTLVANPGLGSVFTGWTNCPAPSGNSCTVDMTADTSVTAHFDCSSFFCFPF